MNTSPFSKITVGILGCANVAQKSAIPAFAALPEVHVQGIASRDPAKAQDWAKKYGFKAYTSYQEMIDDTTIDAIYVPLPIGLHEKWTIKAAHAGKHVLCEKSLAGSLASVQRMVDVCRRKKVVLFENFMCEYHPQHTVIRKEIHQGRIGQPVHFKGYFGFPPLTQQSFRYDPLLGGGSLNDAGAYTVFMSRFLFQQEPVAVSCVLNNEQQAVDIHGSALLEFPEGRTALLAFGFDNIYQNNYELWGTTGLIRANRAYSIAPTLTPLLELVRNEQMQEKIEKILCEPANQFELIFKDFFQMIAAQDVQQREKKYQQILQQARVVEALRIAAKEQRRVELNEVRW